MDFTPSYIKLLHSGELEKRTAIISELPSHCTICPRECGIDRSEELGFCLSGYLPIVSSYTPHFGEEPLLSGSRGAGNIFFGNCNMRCVFCQNFEISQNWLAEMRNEISVERLAEIMLELQEKKCHNIGLVSPTHFSAPIIQSIFEAAKLGLNLPVIYNSNGYDSVGTLKYFEDVIDIYLPDMKYGGSEYARTYSKAPDYLDKAKSALSEMYRQVGHELVVENGVVMRGMIIRHLVLPNDLAETENVFNFIANELSPKVHISLMSQYFPTNKSSEFPLIDRRIRESEYYRAMELLDKYGLENGWVQELDSHENYRPEFRNDRKDPFNNSSIQTC